MAYWNGTTIVYESFDYMLQAQTHALHGSPTQTGSIPAAYKTAYDNAFLYGSNELKRHGKQDRF